MVNRKPCLESRVEYEPAEKAWHRQTKVAGSRVAEKMRNAVNLAELRVGFQTTDHCDNTRNNCLAFGY
jgi:hypothetical protein